MPKRRPARVKRLRGLPTGWPLLKSGQKIGCRAASQRRRRRGMHSLTSKPADSSTPRLRGWQVGAKPRADRRLGRGMAGAVYDGTRQRLSTHPSVREDPNASSDHSGGCTGRSWRTGEKRLSFRAGGHCRRMAGDRAGSRRRRTASRSANLALWPPDPSAGPRAGICAWEHAAGWQLSAATCFDGEVTFFPGNGLRAVVKTRSDVKPLGVVEGMSTLDQFCDLAAGHFAAEPWLAEVVSP